MQPERMQHGRSTLHDNQDGDGKEEPNGKEDEQDDGAGEASKAKGDLERHGPQDNGKLLMGEGKRPKTEVGCGVGDTVETEFCREDKSVSDGCTRFSTDHGNVN